MIKNKKGFMLAEIIIVSVVVMIGLVGLFSFVSKIFLEYDKRIVYDNVDATYVARGLAESKTKDLIVEVFEDDDIKYAVYNLDEDNINIEIRG